eukprot:6206379-Lingulodinium_polyedra.AAC.1
MIGRYTQIYNDAGRHQPLADVYACAVQEPGLGKACSFLGNHPATQGIIVNRITPRWRRATRDCSSDSF